MTWVYQMMICMTLISGNPFCSQVQSQSFVTRIDCLEALSEMILLYEKEDINVHELQCVRKS